jgi:phosphoglycolate phosphatase
MPSDAAEALPTPPDAILFDLDGTIIDSRVPFFTSVNYMLAAHNLPQRSPEELLHYLGPPTRIMLTDMFGDDEPLKDAALATYREHYARTSPDTTLVFPGVRELLQELHGRVKLAVATSKIGPSAVMLLEHLELADLFDVISGPAASALAEPKAVTVASALAALGGPQHAVMVGDRLYDVGGAREQGLPTIGVLWGAGSEAELRDAGAAAIVAVPDEIPPLLHL